MLGVGSTDGFDYGDTELLAKTSFGDHDNEASTIEKSNNGLSLDGFVDARLQNHVLHL